MKCFSKRALAVAFIMLSVVLASCGKSKPAASVQPTQQSQSEASAQPTASESKELVVWILSSFNTESERNYYNQMINEIDLLHDEFTVRVEVMPDIFNVLLASVVSGDLPDISMSDGARTGLLAHAEVFIPLDKYLPDEIRADLLPSIIDECTYKNQIYFFAQYDSGHALWANKKLLSEVGARIPVSYKDAWDKAEFEEICAKLKEKGYWAIDIGQYNQTGTNLYYAYLPVLKSFGGDWMNRETMMADGGLNSEGTIAAAEYLHWLAQQGYLDERADSDDGFLGRQDTALLLYGNWMTPDVETILGDDGILVPIPDFGNGVYSVGGSQTWGITVQAEENGTLDECVTFMLELLDPDFIQAMTDSNGSIASRRSVLEKDLKYQPGEKLYLYREQLEAGIVVNRPNTPAMTLLRTAGGQAVRDAMTYGNARELLNQAAKDVDQLIVDNKYND